MAKRFIGLFGGTFDPIHQGHLILAERVRDAAGLDEVWFLPSFEPPHKVGTVISRFEHRVEMTSLAIVGQPMFRVEAIERDLPPPSFTVRTLAALQTREPDAHFALIVGADCLPDLPKWHHPAEILERAELLVVPRPGVALLSAKAVAESLSMPESAVRIRAIPCPLVEIASREIRRSVAAGQSIRYLVPRAVEEYIREKSLYRS
jgi:nicotinate-nucleotide adenylyltransferase